MHAWEQAIKQQVLLDIKLPLAIQQCADDLAKTIDYAELCQAVTDFVAAQSFQLIETIAATVTDFIIKHFNVTPLSVAVSKPYAVLNAGLVQVIAEENS